MLDKQADKWIVGTALALAASTLLPMLKSTLKPLAEEGLRSGAGLTDKLKYAYQVAREEIEDIVVEAQFERMKKRIDREIASE